jgi:UDP:flavonoid glycosyltransferase YjiC (YdhE family)
VARILCAWEFGGDLGHIRTLLPIARALRAMGHEVAVAFRDATLLDAAVGHGFEGFAAPHMRTPRVVSASPLNFSHVLLNLGFGDSEGLAGALRGWRALLALLRTDLVVCDYAPTALLAARSAQRPCVTVGSGFCVPRAEHPSPALRPWEAAQPEALRALDARLIEGVAQAMPGASIAGGTVHTLLRPNADLLCTFAELDPFGPRDHEYFGPADPSGDGVAVDWTQAALPRVLAYLKPRDSRFVAVVQALRTLPVEAIVAAPGLAPADAAATSTALVRVVPGAVKLAPLFADASLCVSHAGPGFAARALAAGVPMALLPMQLEQYLIARRVCEARSAVAIAPEDVAPDFRGWIAQALASAALRRAAATLARRYHGFSFDEAPARVAARIASLAS